jgi:hypothetical protein
MGFPIGEQARDDGAIVTARGAEEIDCADVIQKSPVERP